MKRTIVLTVFNRPDLVLTNTILALSRNDLRDTEILVVDDGSTVDYEPVREMFDEWGLPLEWIRADSSDCPGVYQLDGHNNPAYVNNLALEKAQGDEIVFVSSDTILPPHAMTRLDAWDLSKVIYSAKVIDIDTGKTWNGRERVFPACWLLAAKKDTILSVGAFDLAYMRGMAFEDPDFSGRLVLATGKLVIDEGTTCFHQSHPMLYMSDGGKGYRASEAYTRKKWGGVPWEGAGTDGVITTTRSFVSDTVIVRCKRGPSCILEERRAA